MNSGVKMINFLDYWAVWLPILVVVSMHAFERTQSQAGVIYSKDLHGIMRKRTQIFSFQTLDQFNNCHIKGSIRVDITEIDPDAFVLMIGKKYPILCYCSDGVQSYRYFERIQPLHKSFWLSGGLNAGQDKVSKYCVWSENED
jgi:rhodanese-related sulfurtransferase